MSVEQVRDYVAVIIHYKAAIQVSRLITNLSDVACPPKKIVVIDNSEDLDIEVLYSPRVNIPVEVIPLPNPGYAAAVNRARLEVERHTEFLLVLTQEVVLESETICRLFSSISNDDRVSLVGPLLYRNSNIESLFSAGGILTSGGETIHLEHRLLDADYDVEWVDGAVMLMRTAVLDEIGGLDEKYFLYFEEVDLAYRMRELGYKVIVNPQARAYQEPGDYTAYLRFRNHILFARSRFTVFRVVLAILAKFIRAIPGWIVRRNFLGPVWSVRGVLDGIRSVVGRPPPDPFSQVHRNRNRILN
ncbi:MULTISPECIES: glycosyltransferase family 2 protein [unclassified Rhodococcus (in: high G+C Gram-positive bacteria)]|uniref:glycosyltransferase family 2 protein n=1 Tax=unclassified Rhodococcus (in: high G+C Gram-positive bacteria) TaxID=192944 RepID=UPI0012F671DF|nr:glycosyltransferase family 2 protein [Rhodococcus sp. DK17]